LLALREPDLRKESEALQKEDAEIGRSAATWAHQQTQEQERRREWLEQLRQLGVDTERPFPALPEHHPELAAVADRDDAGWETELQRREDAVRANRSDRMAAAHTLGIGEDPLDWAAEQNVLAQAERDLAIKRRAGEIVAHTRQSIVNRVMPLTMQNMRLILPLVTEGRYQDAEWDEQSNVISVYDSRAGSFQRKRVFSGGARDQISLALRLAFALATLPGEHNIQPGWLFLDEPLSSFDHSRTQALVDLVTLPRALVRRQFAQIFLISHSQSFDPSQFDYRIRMDAGQVVECTLPAPAGAAET
jgi:DNA repair exonuclease SbcCD ATPase subunit